MCNPPAYKVMAMCTGLRLISDDKSAVYGRTLEFGADLKSNILIIPKGYHFAGTTHKGPSTGLSWRSQYRVVGVNALGINHFVDGLNEMGLSGGLFYFPRYAEYQVKQNSEKTTLAPWELLTWILTNFSTTTQIKEQLSTITVAPIVFEQWHMVMPIHVAVHDRYGNSLVVEYLKGTVNIYDNPLGVLTNSPNFEWHMTNLNNYVGLSTVNEYGQHIGGLNLEPFGQGSGLRGLPGDFTPVSRFVRAVVFSQAVASQTATDAVDNAFHILNLFNIPKGIAKEKTTSDYTQWTSVCDMSNLCYYFNTYENNHIRMIDLNKVPVNTSSEQIISMASTPHMTNITPVS